MIKKMSAYSRILKEMAPYLKEVEESIAANLTTKVELVKAIDSYVIKSGGKRFRPMLMIITARMCGYEGRDYAPLATVIEYLHSATLLHDDVLDGAKLRRGNPSANNKWGNAAAVLSGDFLFSQAFTLLVEHYSKEITLCMLQAARNMIDGEVLELSGRRVAGLIRERYYEVISLKTASLIAASCEAGALLSGCGTGTAEAMRSFGTNLGMAFQIIDDVLDYTGDAGSFGKVPGGDLREGTITLPLILLLEKLSGGEKKGLESIIGSGAILDEDITRVIELIRAHGMDKASYAEADLFIDKAREALSSFEEGPYRRMLEVAADYVLSRQV